MLSLSMLPPPNRQHCYQSKTDPSANRVPVILLALGFRSLASQWKALLAPGGWKFPSGQLKGAVLRPLQVEFLIKDVPPLNR